MKAQKAASWSNSQLRVALLPMLGMRWSAITWWRGWWTDDYGNDCEGFDDGGGADSDNNDEENETAYYMNGGGDVIHSAPTSQIPCIYVTVGHDHDCQRNLQKWFFSDKSHSPWKMFNCKRSEKGVKLRFFLNLSPSKVGLKWHLEAEGCPHHNPQHASRFFTLQRQDADNHKTSNESFAFKAHNPI